MRIVLIFIIFCFLPTSVSAEEKNYPRTIALAVDSIIESMSDEGKITLKSTNKLDLIQFHL